jgi:hypothetical protein
MFREILLLPVCILTPKFRQCHSHYNNLQLVPANLSAPERVIISDKSNHPFVKLSAQYQVNGH